MKHIKQLCLFTFSLALSLIGCKSDNETISPPDEETFSISNDVAALNARVHSRNETVSIRSVDGGRLDGSVTLTLVQEIDPPLLESQPVMATSIVNKENQLAVSYNTAGAQYGGAVVLMSLDDDDLSITSQISSDKYDVSHALLHNSSLYATGSRSIAGEVPAWVGRFGINNGKIQKNSFIEASVGGYVGTSISSAEDGIYVTSGVSSGSGGGITKLSETDLSEISSEAKPDSRWGVFSNSRLYVQNGIPGEISVFESGAQINTFSVADASFEAKATFNVLGDYLFIATGQNGVQMHHIDGTFDSEIPLPETGAADLNTNSVAVYGDLIFISNGAGLFVATYTEGGNLTPEIVGEIELDDYESVNHIAFVGSKLIVASGLGGVKVIELIIEETPPAEGEILSNSDMSITYFDSEEPKMNRYADYLIDDDPNSFWHTEWVDADPEYPHEIHVDLGATYDLTEFRYLSRQVGNFNGTVDEFELYISSDGIEWGMPFYSGNFSKTRNEQIVTFSPVTGRYFRFLALSEVNGNPWASGSEFNFVGTLNN